MKKEIIRLLHQKPHVMGQLERKMGTADSVIKRQIMELHYLGIGEVVRHKRHPKTGRPYTTVKLTEAGQSLSA